MKHISSSCVWSTQRFLSATIPEPLSLSIPLPDENPFELYVRLTRSSRPSFLLESGGAAPSLARYSYIGYEPYQTFSTKGPSYELLNGKEHIRGHGDPFSIIEELFAGSTYERVPNLPPFIGGAVGFFSYDLVRQFEQLPEQAVTTYNYQTCFSCLWNFLQQ